MRNALLGLGLASMGVMGGCWLPTPSDWSGGYEGIYQGSVDFSQKTRRDSGSTSTTKGTQLVAVELVAANSPFTTHLLKIGPCGGIPMRSGPLGLGVATPLPSCESTDTDSGGRTDHSYEVTDATIKNGLGPTGEVTFHLEFTQKSRSTPNSGSSTTDTTTTIFDFTGKKL